MTAYIILIEVYISVSYTVKLLYYIINHIYIHLNVVLINIQFHA